MEGFQKESKKLVTPLLDKKNSKGFNTKSNRLLEEASQKIKALRWLEGPSKTRGPHILEIAEEYLKQETENAVSYKGKINKDKRKKLGDILKKLNTSSIELLETLKKELQTEAGGTHIPSALPIIDKSPYDSGSMEDKEKGGIWDR